MIRINLLPQEEKAHRQVSDEELRSGARRERDVGEEHAHRIHFVRSST